MRFDDEEEEEESRGNCFEPIMRDATVRLEPELKSLRPKPTRGRREAGGAAIPLLPFRPLPIERILPKKTISLVDGAGTMEEAEERGLASTWGGRGFTSERRRKGGASEGRGPEPRR